MFSTFHPIDVESQFKWQTLGTMADQKPGLPGFASLQVRQLAVQGFLPSL